MPGPVLAIPEQGALPLPAEARDNEEREALRRRFELWTCQQVLDAFGRPNWIMYGENTHSWWWKYKRGGDAKLLPFRFQDGFVWVVSDE